MLLGSEEEIMIQNSAQRPVIAFECSFLQLRQLIWVDEEALLSGRLDERGTLASLAKNEYADDRENAQWSPNNIRS